MISKKQYLKNKPVAKVTLELSAEMVGEANEIFVVGDFNGWNVSEHPMKKLKDGTFKVTLDLEANKEHQFRYLVDGHRWLNESEADKFVPTGVSYEENSVLVL
ncbi:MAG: isoamylase early set domain-containing protein [Luteibaculaceae bacterium]